MYLIFLKCKQYIDILPHFPRNTSRIFPVNDVSNLIAIFLYSSTLKDHPWGPWGFKTRMGPPYPHARRKRRLKWAVSLNNREKGCPVSVLAWAR